MEKELILKIMKEALEINNRAKNTVFIYYHGHVNVLEICIYTRGWKKDENPDYSKRICLDIEYVDAEKELTEILEDLNKIKELSVGKIEK